MDQALLQRLEREPLPRVLFVHGQEAVWRDRVFELLKQRSAQDEFGQWNWSVLYGSKELSLDAVTAELAMVPWGDSPRIVVLRGAQQVPADTMHRLVQWLAEHPDANCLALFFDQVDEGWKFLQPLRQIAVEIQCSVLEGPQLTEYVSRYCAEQGKRMDKVTVQLFLARVGSNLQVIHNELEKLLAYTGERGEITSADVEEVTSLWPEQIANHAIFQLTDFIVQKKRPEALRLLQQLLQAGEVPLKILALIERQLRLLLAAKTGGSNLELAAREMGESRAFLLKKMRAQAGRFSLDEIILGFHAIVQADGEIKLGAPGEEVLTDLIIKLT